MAKQACNMVCAMMLAEQPQTHSSRGSRVPQKLVTRLIEQLLPKFKTVRWVDSRHSSTRAAPQRPHSCHPALASHHWQQDRIKVRTRQEIHLPLHRLLQILNMARVDGRQVCLQALADELKLSMKALSGHADHSRLHAVRHTAAYVEAGCWLGLATVQQRTMPALASRPVLYGSWPGSP